MTGLLLYILGSQYATELVGLYMLVVGPVSMPIISTGSLSSS